MFLKRASKAFNRTPEAVKPLCAEGNTPTPPKKNSPTPKAKVEVVGLPPLPNQSVSEFESVVNCESSGRLPFNQSRSSKRSSLLRFLAPKREPETEENFTAKEEDDIVSELVMPPVAGKKKRGTSLLRVISARLVGGKNPAPLTQSTTSATVPIVPSMPPDLEEASCMSSMLVESQSMRELPSALYFESDVHVEHPADPNFPLSAIVILNFGHAWVQSGPASALLPEASFPMVYGTRGKHLKNLHNTHDGPEPTFFGRDAEKEPMVTVKWFNEVEDKEMPPFWLVGDMLVYNTSHMLRRPLKQDALIFPVDVRCTIAWKTRLATLCFERLGARAVRMCSEELVSLQLITGLERPTGMVVDIGHMWTRVMCIVDGDLVETTARRTRAAGKSMTLRMQRLLQDENKDFGQTQQVMEFARQAKEKHCAVRPASPSSFVFKPINFEFSPGNCVVLGPEIYECTEILFDPSKDINGVLTYAKTEAMSVQQTFVESLRAYDDRNLWEELVSNVVVYGGSSRFPGMHERISFEIEKAFSETPSTSKWSKSLASKLRIQLVSDAPWLGAKLLMEEENRCSHVSSQWINRKEWKDGGETCVKERLNQLERV